MDIERKRSDFKALTRVVRKTELLEIFLLNSSVYRAVDVLDYETVVAGFTFEGELFERKEDTFSAKVNLSIAGSPKDEEDKNLIEITAEYILTYAVENYEGLSNSDLEIFCGMNSLYNVWAFWREYIQSTCNRMEVPAFTLPLLKFRPRKKKEPDKPVDTPKAD